MPNRKDSILEDRLERKVEKYVWSWHSRTMELVRYEVVRNPPYLTFYDSDNNLIDSWDNWWDFLGSNPKPYISLNDFSVERPWE